MKNKGAPCCYGRWLIRNSIGRKGTPPCGECLACEAADGGVPSLNSLKKAELAELITERDIEVDPKATKADMIAAIEADDRDDDEANDETGDDEVDGSDEDG